MTSPCREAANQLFDECFESVRRSLTQKLACPHDAEDLAQEACLKLFIEWQRRNDIENPRAYSLQIARNLLYVHYSRKSTQLTDNGIDWDELMADEQSLEDWANESLQLERVERVWHELSPKCQQALRLRWKEGLRVAEIADQMNLSTAMVKKYLARALALCRRRLGRAIAAERAAA